MDKNTIFSIPTDVTHGRDYVYSLQYPYGLSLSLKVCKEERLGGTFMTNLIRKINEISDVYDDFVLGVINYAKRKPEHVKILNDYIDSNPNLTTSDIVEFIIQQPDFHSYSATIQKKVG